MTSLVWDLLILVYLALKSKVPDDTEHDWVGWKGAQPRPGDLVAYGGDVYKVQHVGLFVGNGYIQYPDGSRERA